MSLHSLYDKITGPCIREIKFSGAPEKSLYLTFDDGPDPICTPKVLQILKEHDAKATFFIIANKAQAYPELIQAIIKEGHTLGNHSLDHDTRNYFKNESQIKEWITKSSELLKTLQIPSIGFRSPVGIKTPALNKVLKDLAHPLILWNIRFYDTQRTLNLDMINKQIMKIKSGSIILLHDTHTDFKQEPFLKGLVHLISESRKAGFEFSSLSEELISKSYLEKYET